MRLRLHLSPFRGPAASARRTLSPAPTATRPLLLGTYTSAEGGGTGIGTAA
ncbi:hypothetical protein [Streptomyces cyaneofuscatus]|uniref:hypothetical protein n=1 Tax=Streptomyces cyaneofuscatus TaxID=66883 RepID=UPI00378FF5C0